MSCNLSYNPSKPKESGRDRLARLANTFNTRSGEVIARNLDDSDGAERSAGVSVGGVMGGVAGGHIGHKDSIASGSGSRGGNQFSYEGSKVDDDDGHGFAPLPAPSLEVHTFQRTIGSAANEVRGGSYGPIRQAGLGRAKPILAKDTPRASPSTLSSHPPTNLLHSHAQLSGKKRKRSHSSSTSSLSDLHDPNASGPSSINPFAHLDELAGIPASAPGIAENVSDVSDDEGGGNRRALAAGGAEEDEDEDMEEVDIARAEDARALGGYVNGVNGSLGRGRSLSANPTAPLRASDKPTPTHPSRHELTLPPRRRVKPHSDEDFESYPVMGEPTTRKSCGEQSGVIDLDDDDDEAHDYAVHGDEDVDLVEVVREMRDGSAGRLPRSSRGGGTGEEYVGKKGELGRQMGKLDEEIKQVEAQLLPLQRLRAQLLSDRQVLQAQINSLARDQSHTSTVQARPSGPSTSNAKPNKSSASQAGTTNYMPHTSSATTTTQGHDDFEWSGMLKRVMKDVWEIEGFRLCQEGVCNANMDGRDILCIMPTGGGKSLTYQLPAILTPGTTIVISPLISLITDQIAHLREAGVECVMLTGTTSTADQNDAFRRLSEGPKRKGKDSDEIKLCYVTPEKVAKSKRFVSVLEKLNSAGRLARIVIDEAHCCSQLGHDFRPDYKKLSVLKNLFPRVPILAVTATLSHKVLPDLLKILRLPPLTEGLAANATGTVYFTAPLYRKNLHYSVVSKPANAKAAIEKMAKYIMDNHQGENGIVYCLSKKDSETVAQGLREVSGGKIKAGVYHADIGDSEKEAIYSRWRRGELQCICATIAFGLGIDNQNTRYVLHHSMSKTMDGYYQETGRAGRDGKDADCVLFYRPQDANRLSSLTMADVEGQAKIYEMLRYAQDLTTCRKIAFAKYFSASASMPSNAWDAGSSSSVEHCGHCDNCSRPPETIFKQDVTLEVWKVLKVVEEVVREGGRVTLGGLADLVRGLGGGSFGLPMGGNGNGNKGKGKASKSEGTLDLDELVGGKVTLSKDHTESLLVDMMLNGYLSEDYHPTAYTVNVYLQPHPGTHALRISRLSKADAEAGRFVVKVEVWFLNEGGRRVKSGGNKEKEKDKDKGKEKRQAKKSKVTKGSKTMGQVDLDGIPHEEDSDEQGLEEDLEEDIWVGPSTVTTKSMHSATGIGIGSGTGRQTRNSQTTSGKTDATRVNTRLRARLPAKTMPGNQSRQQEDEDDDDDEDEDVIMLDTSNPGPSSRSRSRSESTAKAGRAAGGNSGGYDEGEDDEEDMEEVGGTGWGGDGKFF